MIKHPELLCYHLMDEQNTIGIAQIDDYSILITNKLRKFIQSEVYKLNNDIENGEE
jgi:hypothetical protein